MVSRSMTLSHYAKVHLPRVERAVPVELGRAVYDNAKNFAVYMRDASLRDSLNYRGNYARAWKARRLRMYLTAETYNNVRNPRNGQSYAPIIEDGQPPGTRPSARDIKPWVRDKLKVPPGQVDAVTFAVINAIYKRGIPSNPLYSHIDFHTSKLLPYSYIADKLYAQYLFRAMLRK